MGSRSERERGVEVADGEGRGKTEIDDPPHGPGSLGHRGDKKTATRTGATY